MYQIYVNRCWIAIVIARCIRTRQKEFCRKLWSKRTVTVAHTKTTISMTNTRTHRHKAKRSVRFFWCIKKEIIRVSSCCWFFFPFLAVGSKVNVCLLPTAFSPHLHFVPECVFRHCTKKKNTHGIIAQWHRHRHSNIVYWMNKKNWHYFCLYFNLIQWRFCLFLLFGALFLAPVVEPLRF